ncbi:GNAT family N-acetyltransferase [Pelagivirga sediminicola]|uniref:GNAT family N-acetyltransferase n=1 Tax=Pelagivirga sediminicola TaxID=2170575 RepID=A0A2T7GC43_9RHOB|nr:GNAT family N-acetyltransferase [Pelagivirga sediminicola]PVA11984.1 GNAT family N-acetyltransferase [Pelagivirga sediminicola]
MTAPDASTLLAVLEATWPAHARRRQGPWTLRDGRGGGKRASAATAAAPVCAADLPDAEAAMRTGGAAPLFMIHEGAEALDALLAGAGYEVIDPVVIYAAPLQALAMDAPSPTASFHIWEPLAIQREIWAEGGIGPARVAVMERVQGDKTALFGRKAGRAAAAGFAAIEGNTAMVHALEVRPDFRRQGVARALMLEAARWAMGRGARHLAVVCTEGNIGARGLYASLGLQTAGRYHYRQHPSGAATP